MTTFPADSRYAAAAAAPANASGQEQSLPRLLVQRVATGGLWDQPSVSASVRHLAESKPWGGSLAVLVLELGEARFETGLLLEMLMSLTKGIRANGQVILVVATSQASVARVVEMVAQTEDVPIFLAASSTDLAQARPAGRLTPTERDSLALLNQLGGRVTASRFATESALELTAAGNRLTNLARRGYLLRMPRSRREGDEFVGLAALSHAQGDPHPADQYLTAPPSAQHAPC